MTMPGRSRRFRRACISFLLLAVSANVSRADVLLNEFLIEPSGRDIGQQFFELKGTPGESLAGLSFVVLLGDPFRSGIVDQVLDLSPFSLGSNGLLLHHDNLGSVPFDPATTVISLPRFIPTFFANTSLTFGLFRDFTEVPGTDLDLDDDGVLDDSPWSEVVDAVGIRANLPGLPPEYGFGEQLGFTDFPIVGFDPDGLFRDGLTNQWYVSDVNNRRGRGPYFIDEDQFVNTQGVAQDLSLFDRDRYTPGFINAAVPEPSGFLLLAVSGVVLASRFRSGRSSEAVCQD